ncbi:MAG: shikimate dehydrogenase [Candidatus Electrothrix sp. AW3_4]|nr:shikimate dehydrogenase [Candidatus Electrothrix gigas]
MIVDTKSNIICSIAEPGSDLTGILYNEIIHEMNLNAIYLPTSCKQVDIGIEGAKVFGFSGVSVSMPYKQEVMKCIDLIDKKAQDIGAVNTVVNQEGSLVGYNTDWYGAVEALKEQVEIATKKVIVFGAGGAARAIIYGLTDCGCEVFIHNRSQDKGECLAREFNSTYLTRKMLEDEKKYDILINSTSIGFMGNNENEDFIPRCLLHEGQIVLDIVFSPIKTKLIKDALSRKCIVIPGYKMLIYQALLQFKLWLASEVSDYSKIERALINFIEKKGL